MTTSRTTGHTSTNTKENTVPTLPNLNRQALRAACSRSNIMVAILGVLLTIYASVYGLSGWFVVDGVALIAFALIVGTTEYRSNVREQRHRAAYQARYATFVAERERWTAELDASRGTPA